MPSAGVYKTEQDLSLYSEIASELKIGLVAPFAKGEINVRGLVTNPSMLENKYGRPIDDDILCQGFFAAQQYLRQGNQLYVVRAESATNPAEYAVSALRGGSEDSIVTANDGVTSIPATRTLTSAGSAFITAGVSIGDVVQIEDVSTPADDGYYVITNVAATVLTVNRDWPTGSGTGLTFTVWTSKRAGGADGVSSAQASRTFTSALAKFITNGVAAGDVLRIHDASTPEDNGFYEIEAVTGETTLTIDRPWRMGSLTALTYTIYGPNHPTGSDGSTATAGEFLSSTAQFGLHKVQAGDILEINDVSTPGNNGNYVITSVKTGSTATTLLVDNDVWPGGSLTNLTYRILPGTIRLQGESKGTWLNPWQVLTVMNSVNSTDFDLNIYNDRGNLVETMYNLNPTNIVGALLNSAYLRGTAGLNRVGPVIGYQNRFIGGEDGTTGLTDADLIGNTSQSTGLQAFKNREEVEVDLLMIPGYSSQNIGDSLRNMAEFTRGDCMFLADPPDFPGVNSPQDVIDWHNGTGGFGRTSALNSSHGATYWPWVKLTDTYNLLNGVPKDRWTAPSGHAAGVWAQSDNAAKPWFAPAGLKRGRVVGGTDIRYSPDNGERDAMQLTNNCVNPIVKFLKDGICIFGQKTLLRTNSALNRINVRRMLLFIERIIMQNSRQLTFEPGDATTDRDFIRLNTPPLDFVKANRGAREYLIICDDSTSPPDVRAQNKMIAKVFVKPTTTAEVIEVQFVLTAQSANFQELLAA